MTTTVRVDTGIATLADLALFIETAEAQGFALDTEVYLESASSAEPVLAVSRSVSPKADPTDDHYAQQEVDAAQYPRHFFEHSSRPGLCRVCAFPAEHSLHS